MVNVIMTFLEKISKKIKSGILAVKNSGCISTTKRKKRIGIATAVLFAVLTIAGANTFFKMKVPGIFLFVFALLLSALVGMSVAVKLDWKGNEKREKWFARACLLLSPVVSIAMVEVLAFHSVFSMMAATFIANYLVYLLFLSALYALTNRIGLSSILFNSVLFVFGLVNHFVITFTGSPFIPLDFLGAGTAMNVAQQYNFFTPEYSILIGCMLFVLLISAARKITYQSKTNRLAVMRRLSSVAAAGIVCFVFYGTTVLESFGLNADLWNQERGAKNYGTAISFWLNTKNMFVSAPKSYDPNKVEMIANQKEKDSAVETVNADQEAAETTQKPNIIGIMNETLSDMSVVGDFETNEDYMPFLRGLTENTIKGNLYMSIYGNGTSNSEFEFLTGNTMAFLPTGSNAYEQYIRTEIPSLVSILRDQGYSRTAVHPFAGDGWNRTTVYPLFGFEQFLDIESFDTSNLMRRYISDSDNYKKVTELYEQRDPEKPFFLFNVTMQNHGGYDKKYDTFDENIYLLDDPDGEKYPKTRQYLSLMKRSDDAFKELVEYFSNVEEPTIIVMFGDHQAKIEQEFYEDVLFGKKLSELTLEEQQKRFMTPFVIWANYDIEEKEIDKMSANYLSSYVLDVAGLETSPYNQYLLSLYEKLPVVNANGYIDSENNYYDYSKETEYSQLLEDYRILQYNNMFDKVDKKQNVFSIPSQSTPAGEQTGCLGNSSAA